MANLKRFKIKYGSGSYWATNASTMKQAIVRFATNKGEIYCEYLDYKKFPNTFGFEVEISKPEFAN